MRPFLVTVAVLYVASALWATGATIQGHITDPDGLPLPGVLVTVNSDAPGPALTTITDKTGRYLIRAPDGRVRFRAELSGFRTVERVDVVVAAEPVVIDLTLTLASIEEQVTVRGEAPHPMMGELQPDAPVTVTREVFDDAMLPNSQYDDVLPLMPNVLRGPDGLISVAGARAPQGALFVNGSNATDPISGEGGVMLPLEAVDSVQVYSGGYAADFGRATGGVTSVSTRSGADAFHMSLNSFFPRMLFQNGSIHGVEYWEPNFGVSGPIVKGRVHYEQALSYRFDRNRFNTRVGPQDSRSTALLSWSQLDVNVSPAQHVAATLSFDPQNVEPASITAFTPATSVPRLELGGWSAALADRLTPSQASSVELRASVIHTSLAVVPNGAAPYQLGHDLAHGSYFDHQDLHGTRLETSAAYTWTPSLNHLVRTGTSIAHATLDGSENSAPVDLLRSNGTVSRAIAFLPGSPIAASTYEIGAFAQDSWTGWRWLTVDAGVRFDQTTVAAHPTLSPRVAWTIKPVGGRASLSGSVGRFGDKLVLESLAFSSQPSRTLQIFDASGAPLGPPVLYSNLLTALLRVPQATRWDLQFDDRFGGGWLARVKYQERYGRDELVVDPRVATGAGLLVLDNLGTSTARSIEATAGYRALRARHEIYISYVRSSTRGDLNGFDVLNGPFRDPFIQPNGSGPLLMDVPNRLLVWGLLHLPARITAAPFIEMRNGFPYSAVNEDWTYDGQRNAYRLPWFGAFDLYVNTIVGLPGPLPDARIGVKFYGLASVHSERDVQRDIGRVDFGTTYNPTPRDFSFVFELLWGHRQG